MIGEMGVTGPDVHVTVLKHTMDIKAWNLLLRDLLVAITSNAVVQARHLIDSYVECNGEFRLAHALQTAYFTTNTDVAWFLFENAPSEVLFRALATNGSRTYSEANKLGRPGAWGRPPTSLLGFMYLMRDFEALHLVGKDEWENVSIFAKTGYCHAWYIGSY